MSSADLSMLLPIISIEAPMILLTLVGLVVAQSRLLPRGSASVLATLGFVLLLAHSLAQLGFQIYLARNSAQDVIGVIALAGMAMRILFLLAFVCLASAIFAGRRLKPHERGEHDSH